MLFSSDCESKQKETSEKFKEARQFLFLLNVTSKNTGLIPVLYQRVLNLQITLGQNFITGEVIHNEEKNLKFKIIKYLKHQRWTLMEGNPKCNASFPCLLSAFLI